LHFCMPTVVVGVLATNYIQIKSQDLWQIPIILVMLALYASLGNLLVPEANFLFLKENGLPFNLFGNAHFYFTYAVLLIILTIIFVLIMIFTSKVNLKKEQNFRNKVRQKVDNIK